MKTVVETLSPTRAKLTVEVPFEELKPSLDKAYKAIAGQINVPGFRRGKVPPAVIDRQVGRGAVLDQAINEVVPAKYFEAMQANELEPLAQPDIEVTRLDDNDILEFTAEVDVKPTFELPDVGEIEATVDTLEVTDADIEEQLEAIRVRFGTLSDVERPVADGDFVTIDLQATKDGEVLEGADVTGISYQVGKGGMLDGLDEALIGMEINDEKTFSSQLVGGDQAGEDVDVLVRVTGVQVQELPELDDDFAAEASEFETLAEMKDDIRERLIRGKRLEQAAAARDAVLEAVLAKVEIPLPETVVTDELNARRANMEQELAYAGLTMASYLEDEGKTIEEFEAELERGVRDAVAAQFVLDKLAKDGDFDIDQAELTQLMMRRAQSSGQDPQEFVNHMIEHNHIPELVGELLRGKALAKLVESSVVKDGNGDVLDLANLLPDGSFAEPTSPDTADSQDDTAESDNTAG